MAQLYRVASARRTIIPVPETPSLRAAPPPRLDSGKSLFLDLDGTLLELIDRPDAVIADDALRSLLTVLHMRLEGRLAIVSGRSIAQLDAILGPTGQALVLSGSHGGETRIAGQTVRPDRPKQLEQALDAMRNFAERHENVLLEDKSLGVALHYRLAPAFGSAASTFATQLAADLGLFLQEGNMMVELRPDGHDKGTAIAQLMQLEILTGSLPIFAGDDITDEAGFDVVNDLGGFGVLVGEPRHSAAHYHLPNPAAVRDWLQEFAL